MIAEVHAMVVESDTQELPPQPERHLPTRPIDRSAPDQVDLRDSGPRQVVIVEDFWVDWQQAAPAR
jgi:hypothetical protein